MAHKCSLTDRSLEDSGTKNIVTKPRLTARNILPHINFFLVIAWHRVLDCVGKIWLSPYVLGQETTFNSYLKGS